MKKQILSAAVSSFLAAGMLTGMGSIAFADTDETATARTGGPSPVTTEFNGGTCAVAPFSTSVSFDTGVKADGNANQAWNGSFADKSATQGGGIQNWQSDTTMNYRPWVGVAAYDGRTISGSIAEFVITAGAEEGAEWSFETLPSGNAAAATNYSLEPAKIEAGTGAFTAIIPTQNDSRPYGHKAAWVVSASQGGSPTDYARGATLTVSGGQLSPLPGESSACQEFFWDGTVQPIFSNGKPGVNGIRVNVSEGDATNISGVVTASGGASVPGSAVSVAADGAVSISVPEQSGMSVTVQLYAGELAIGEPFLQPLLNAVHESTPTEHVAVEPGKTATLPAPKDANGQDFPVGTTFAAMSVPRLVGQENTTEEAPEEEPDGTSSSFALFAAEDDSWATVAEDGTITLTPGDDVAAGIYALEIEATLPAGQSDDVTVHFAITAVDETPGVDETTPGGGDATSGNDETTPAEQETTPVEEETTPSPNVSTSSGAFTPADQLPSTGLDGTLMVLAIGALGALAGGAYLVRRRALYRV